MKTFFLFVLLIYSSCTTGADNTQIIVKDGIQVSMSSHGRLSSLTKNEDALLIQGCVPQGTPIEIPNEHSADGALPPLVLMNPFTIEVQFVSVESIPYSCEAIQIKSQQRNDTTRKIVDNGIITMFSTNPNGKIYISQFIPKNKKTALQIAIFRDSFKPFPQNIQSELDEAFKKDANSLIIDNEKWVSPKYQKWASTNR